MATRSSTRSSVPRDIASSPAKSAISETPTRRTTRSTRSQSRELGENDVPARRTRQGSAESLDSTGRSRAGGRSRKTRAAADLSVVDEDEGGGEEEEQLELGSPGALSNFSGTTALTSHSAQELSDLDTSMIVDLLKELHTSSARLIQFLAPENATAEHLQETIQQLQVPGSKKGKMLLTYEKMFESTRENYGSEAFFINPEIILRKLFRDDEVEAQDYRPEAILHEANIAILIKTLLVAQQEKPQTFYFLQSVDDLLPSCFLSEYSAEINYGSSALMRETFELGLAIRTQLIIAALKRYKDDPNYDFNPDEIVAQVFYDLPDHREISSSYEDLITGVELRHIAGLSADTVSSGTEDTFHAKVIEQIDSIRSTFNRESEAIDDEDLVDFDQLNELFPWELFLENIIQWSQLRMEEIEKNINSQGDIDRIVGALAEKVKSLDSQIELSYEQPKATKAAQIVPAAQGKSLYNSPGIVRTLFSRFLPSSSASSSANQAQTRSAGLTAQPSTPNARRNNHVTQSSAPAKITNEMRDAVDDFRPIEDYDEPAPTQGRSTQELLDIHAAGVADMNKENRLRRRISPVRHQKRFVDPQANAQRLAWSEPGDDSQSTQRKRRRDLIDDEAGDSSDSEDTGFQNDQRRVDESRRNRQAPVPSPKRVRIAVDDDEREEDQRAGRQGEEHSEASPRATNTQDEPSAAQRDRTARDDTVSEIPAPYSQISSTAREQNAIARASELIPRIQKRVPWSDEETEALIQLIEKFGGKWALILEKGRRSFEPHRDQVALKDKARNIKVAYLCSGTPFRQNFDAIALGKKEKDKVRNAGYNPNRLEGEEVGEESVDPGQ